MKNSIRLFIFFAVMIIAFSASAQKSNTQQKDLTTTLKQRHDRHKQQKNKRKFLKSKSTSLLEARDFNGLINDSKFINKNWEA